MGEVKDVVTNTESGAGDENESQPLSPAARVFQDPRLNCFIVSVFGCKIPIMPEVVIRGLAETLANHPRFRSKLDYDNRGNPRWVSTKVRAEEHVIIPDLDSNIENPEQFIEDYVSNLSIVPMDMSKPLWEVHILNIKTSEAESVGVLKLHHSIGDGMSLMSLILACTRKTSDPESVPSLPTRKRRNETTTALFLRDTQTPLKGLPGVEFNRKTFVHRTISLDDIKLIKNTLDMTVNDVLLGVTQAGLTRYLNQKYGEDENFPKENYLPDQIRLRAVTLVNLRPSTNIQDLADMMAKNSDCRWGNWIGYIIFPFTIAHRVNPLDHLTLAKAAIDRKKLSFEAVLTHICNWLLVTGFGVEASAKVVHRILSNTTLSLSNMVGPAEEISFYGHPMVYMAPSVYGHPHALTLHFQSHMDKLTLSLATDKTVIPDPHRLCDALEESLKSLKIAVLERGSAEEM